MDACLQLNRPSIGASHVESTISSKDADYVANARFGGEASGLDESNPFDVQPFGMDLVAQDLGSREGLTGIAPPVVSNQLFHGLRFLQGISRS